MVIMNTLECKNSLGGLLVCLIIFMVQPIGTSYSICGNIKCIHVHLRVLAL